MPEVKVEKQKSLARREAPSFGELFSPMFPVGRFFGLSPFAMMREFTEHMDRAFRGGGAAAPSLEAWSPSVDVQRCNDSLVVTVELPGLRKEDVKVEMTDEELTIEGERKQEHKEDHEGYHRYERSYGKFYRAIPLPEGAKTDQAKAELTEGVLKISMPVPEMKKKTRQIPVQEAAVEKKQAVA